MPLYKSLKDTLELTLLGSGFVNINEKEKYVGVCYYKVDDIEFYLIDVYQIKDTLYFEYNSSVGYHECVALRTDFSKLMDKQYYEQTVTSIYNYICELFDADDDDSYLFED